MKKLLAVILALALCICSAINVFAAEACTDIPMTADNIGATFESLKDVVTFTETGFNAKDIEMITFKLDKEVPMNDTVVVRIKGSSTADFRVWLIGEGVATASNQCKVSNDFGFTSGEFDYTIVLTATDYDSRSITVANEIAVKGPAYGTNLEDITVDYLGIFYGTLDEYNAALAQAEAAPTEEPAADAPADDAPASEAPAAAPAADETPAETGVVLALVPVIASLAAVVFTKKK